MAHNTTMAHLANQELERTEAAPARGRGKGASTSGGCCQGRSSGSEAVRDIAGETANPDVISPERAANPDVISPEQTANQNVTSPQQTVTSRQQTVTSPQQTVTSPQKTAGKPDIKSPEQTAKLDATSPQQTPARPATAVTTSQATTYSSDGDGSAIAATVDGEKIVEQGSSGGEQLQYIWPESKNRDVAPDGSPLFGGETGQATGPGTINGYVVDPPSVPARSYPESSRPPCQTEPETEPDRVPA